MEVYREVILGFFDKMMMMTELLGLMQIFREITGVFSRTLWFEIRFISDH
jgi:hypothetical protein